MDTVLTICTIGYQGKSIEDVISDLRTAGVALLVDVRRRPISRKPGFSKKSLTRELRLAGIDYLHLPDLGMPLDLIGLKNDRDNTPILKEYERRLPEFEPYLRTISAHASDRVICLLCFEADHAQCHRRILAEFMERDPEIVVVHL